MEIWGHCTSCGRWFYCGATDAEEEEKEEEAWRCPVCDSEPAVIERRAPT